MKSFLAGHLAQVVARMGTKTIEINTKEVVSTRIEKKLKTSQINKQVI